MKTKFSLALSAVISVGSLSASLVKIDFGSVTNTTGGAETYNNVTLTGNLFDNATTDINAWSGGGGGTPAGVSLVDTTGAATGWTLDGTITRSTINSANPEFGIAGAGGNFTGTVAPLAASAFPSSATTDGLFLQDGSEVTFSISGLNDALTYNLLGFVGRDNNTGASISVGLGAGTGQLPYFQAQGGTITNSEISGLNPNGGSGGLAFGWNKVSPIDGLISFSVSADSTGAGSLVDLKALSVAAVPEPSSALLFGSALGGVLLLGSRRRVS